MSIKKFKKGCMKTFGLLLLSGMLLTSVTPVYASGLNGIGQQTQTQQVGNNQNNNDNSSDNTTNNNTNNTPVEESNAGAVGSLFSNLGPKDSDFAKANELLRPLVTGINYVVAVGLGILSAVLLLITLLDMFYICVPIIRRWLDGGRSAGQQQGGGMQGGMGMQGGGMGMHGGGMGYGGGMSGGYGHGGAQPSQAQSFCGQWVSDEAVATYMECNPQAQGGGMQGGGMGMGMQQQAQPTAPRKMMLTTYAKKRLVFFFAFGICLVVLFTTLFTEIGINVGVWIIGKFSGLM